ncbi:MAG: hypothetical protein ACK5W9_07880 [Bdellovibrionales bacterium]
MSRIALLQKIFSMTFLFLSLVGCFREQPASYIVIAVDNLSFADAVCSEDRSGRNSGIQILCNESVKWTHAYTTSLLSTPAITSLMTGLHPLDSKVRHPGHFLKPDTMTVGRAAYEAGLRTIFLSGGPPVLKKTGLGQGFEVFEDFLELNVSPWLRPFRKNIEVFQQWLADLDNHEGFFTVFYVPDLRFLSRPLMNSFGDPLEKSFDTQFEEFDATLFDLIQKIRKSGRWDNTNFILVGLQGRDLYDRKVFHANANLHSESTQVAFFWKPQQRRRDSPVSWTMDKNISIADIGVSLLESLGASAPRAQLENASLLISLSKPDSAFTDNRLHLIESSWAHWLLGAPVQYAMIREEELFLHTEPPQVFRTLSDRLETNPLSGSSMETSKEFFLNVASELKLTPFSPPDIPKLSRWNFGYWDWMSEQLSAIKSATSTTPWNEIPEGLRPWTARALIESSDWVSLKSASEAWKVPYLTWLAQKQIGVNTNIIDPCLRISLDSFESDPRLRDCQDPAFLEILTSSKSENKSRRWERILEERMLQTSILRMNRALGGVWDVNEKMETVIGRVEVFFRAPEHRALFRQVQRKIKSIELQSTQPERL